MIALRKWILGLAGTALACAVSYQFLDRPIALVFHNTVAHPEPLADLTHLPDPFVPLAIMTFVGLGLWSLSGRLLSRLQKCAFLCSVSLIVTKRPKHNSNLSSEGRGPTRGFTIIRRSCATASLDLIFFMAGRSMHRSHPATWRSLVR